MEMKLKEIVLEDSVDNIYAISLVKDPAIEENFMHFKRFKFGANDVYYYTLKPEYTGDEMVIDTSHELCKSFAEGESLTYTEDEIKGWAKYANADGWGMLPDAARWFQNFPNEGTNLPMYGCRHYLKKKQMFHHISSTLNFEVSPKPRRIVGPVMIANMPMLRPPEEMDGLNYGYVWYSNETLKKYFEKFGQKNNATFLHEIDISEHLLMTKTWIDESDPLHHKWFVEYYVLSEFIWQQILDGSIKGFSVEMVGTLV